MFIFKLQLRYLHRLIRGTSFIDSNWMTTDWSQLRNHLKYRKPARYPSILRGRWNRNNGQDMQQEMTGDSSYGICSSAYELHLALPPEIHSKQQFCISVWELYSHLCLLLNRNSYLKCDFSATSTHWNEVLKHPHQWLANYCILLLYLLHKLLINEPSLTLYFESNLPSLSSSICTVISCRKS